MTRGARRPDQIAFLVRLPPAAAVAAERRRRRLLLSMRHLAFTLSVCSAVWVLPLGGAPDAAGYLTERDVPALRPRLQTALQRYSDGADTMDCAYPNKKEWWTSLSLGGINIV